MSDVLILDCKRHFVPMKLSVIIFRKSSWSSGARTGLLGHFGEKEIHCSVSAY